MNRPDNILFDKRKLKKLFKEGYKYITFDVKVTAWTDKPYFVPSDNIKNSKEENIKNGLWINTKGSLITLSSIKVNEPSVHIYSIERALQIVPNSSQKE